MTRPPKAGTLVEPSPKPGAPAPATAAVVDAALAEPRRLPLGWQDVESELRSRVEDRLVHLHELPLMTVRLVASLEDPNSNPKDVAAMASTEPAVAAELFRIVNSAFFGLREPVGSLQRAVLYLGYNRVKFIVTRLGLERCVPEGSVSEKRLAAVWRHSFLTSTALQTLGPLCPGLNAQEAQTAALLHDLGKLLLEDLSFREGFAENLELDSNAVSMEDRVILEDECFGINHCILGDKLSERLKLPPLVRAVQSYHHHPLDRLPPEARRGAGLKTIAAVKLSSLLARAFVDGLVRPGADSSECAFAEPEMSPYRRLFPALPSFGELASVTRHGLSQAQAFLDSVVAVQASDVA